MHRLTKQDEEILHRAASLETGGFAAFTSYFFAPVYGNPRWDLVGKPPDTWDPPLKEGDYVPWVPLPWQMMVAHESRNDGTIIGGFGCGKTVGIAAVLVYYCVMLPYCKTVTVAPTLFQARQMFEAMRDDLINWSSRHENPTRITRLVSRIVERPYPVIRFWNGSTAIFMSASEHGKKILSWSGDVVVIDEAGKMEELGIDLNELIMNLGSRTRGSVQGRPRLGKLIVLSNADPCPALWERADMAEALPEYYYLIRLSTYDNPYLTRRQVEDIERRITDPTKRFQYMHGERPLPRGKEFSESLLAKAKDPNLDAEMESGLKNHPGAYDCYEAPRAGVVYWVCPPEDERSYIVVGDPGQGSPPERNSPVVMVFDITGFPEQPATLRAFAWIDGGGSYEPFVTQFEEWVRLYRPVVAAFDATGPQKGLDEMVFRQRGLLVEGLQFSGRKFEMVNNLKMLMDASKIRLPAKIQGIWVQLAGWQNPDRKLRQDVAATLFMAAHVMYRFYYEAASEQEAWGELRIPRRPARLAMARPARYPIGVQDAVA